MKPMWLGLIFLVGCAPGTRELRLRADVDPLLERGQIAPAIAAAERAGGLDARRRRAAAETVVWSALRAPAAAVRLRAVEVAQALADPPLDRLLPERLADPDGRVRAVAAAALAGQSEAAVAVLDRALADPDPRARALALDGIAHATDPAGALTRLAADPDPSVRSACADTLAHFTAPRALGHRLLSMLATDADAGVRSSALRALGARGDRSALPAIEQALSDPALAPRLAALWALARLDGGSPRLLALASSGPSPLDRFVALRAAVQLHALGRSDVLDAVRAAAADRRADEREAAMNAAGQLGLAGATLARPLLRDPELAVRLAAARALVHLGHLEEARQVLLAALTTPLALDAADELARLGDPRGTSPLDAAARAADSATRRLAVALLAPLPGSEPALTHALADSDFEVRLTAAEALLRRALGPRPER
jgi:HEAT repeat protein